jgi:hypothetical protein
MGEHTFPMPLRASCPHLLASRLLPLGARDRCERGPSEIYPPEKREALKGFASGSAA